jgi:glutaminase
MSTCGMYDYSGGWIFDVGMPAKSGVGGGIMAVLPGQFGLGVFSPPLDAKGNSVRGIEACKRVSNDFSLHLFKVAHATSASVIRHSYDCVRTRSGRRLGPEQHSALSAIGHQIRVYELQGELMFGSAESVTLRMLADLDRSRFLIVDLKRVVGIDGASVALLLKLCERASRDDKVILFTETGHLYDLRRRLNRSVSLRQEPHWIHFEATPKALEWCEGQLIGASNLDDDTPGDLCHQYLCTDMSEDEIASVQEMGKERRFAADESIVRVGEIANSLYFVLDGDAEVWLAPEADANLPGRGRLRLTTIGPGMVFGEIGLLSGRQRTANVTALTEVSCLEVRLEDLTPEIRNRMLVNMASHFADMLRERAELMQHLA